MDLDQYRHHHLLKLLLKKLYLIRRCQDWLDERMIEHRLLLR
jgi:hypothetical protein